MRLAMIIPAIAIAWGMSAHAMGTDQARPQQVSEHPSCVDPRMQELLELLKQLEGTHPLDPLWPDNREDLPITIRQKIDRLLQDIKASSVKTTR